MKKKLITIILKIAGFAKKNKYYNGCMEKEKKLVNLGCGMHCLQGWLNIDGSLTALLGTKSRFLNKILYRLAGSSQYYTFEIFNEVIVNKKLRWYNLVDGIPLKDTSIDVVFTSHFLEHLSKTDGYRLLQESFRVLKPNGLIRIAVPDLDIAIKKFNAGEIESTQDLFFYTSEDCDFSAHKYNYTFDTLKNKLEKIGFKNVIKCNYQEGECPDIGYLDVYPDHSLYVEAKK